MDQGSKILALLSQLLPVLLAAASAAYEEFDTDHPAAPHVANAMSALNDAAGHVTTAQNTGSTPA